MNTAAITLTKDQQNALDAIYSFLLDPIEQVFVLEGYSGCGKSTLVRTLVNKTMNFLEAARLVQPSIPNYTIELTATTNKAAENLSYITGQAAKTIHSFLGLRVKTNFKTDVSTLVPNNNNVHHEYILFIDEASYVDSSLLEWIFKKTSKCKIIFVGDPAQLTPINSKGVPVFASKFQSAALTEVVRQAKGNPIVDLSTKFRNTVNTGEFFSFRPDGHHIQHLSKQAFMQAIEQEFARPNWSYQDSKILTWTNKTAISYNQYVRNSVKGDPHFQVGDYAVNNSFITAGKYGIKTDELVHITNIESDTKRYDVAGNVYEVDHVHKFFMPKSLQARNARILAARKAGHTSTVADIETTWIDLRAAYACTINKAQGSTHDRVFIDLDDVSRCNNGETLARLLYVAVSRARNQVFLTGDLIK